MDTRANEMSYERHRHIIESLQEARDRVLPEVKPTQLISWSGPKTNPRLHILTTPGRPPYTAISAHDGIVDVRTEGQPDHDRPMLYAGSQLLQPITDTLRDLIFDQACHMFGYDHVLATALSGRHGPHFVRNLNSAAQSLVHATLGADTFRDTRLLFRKAVREAFLQPDAFALAQAINDTAALRDQDQVTFAQHNSAHLTGSVLQSMTQEDETRSAAIYFWRTCVPRYWNSQTPRPSHPSNADEVVAFVQQSLQIDDQQYQVFAATQPVLFLPGEAAEIRHACRALTGAPRHNQKCLQAIYEAGIHQLIYEQKTEDGVNWDTWVSTIKRMLSRPSADPDEFKALTATYRRALQYGARRITADDAPDPSAPDQHTDALPAFDYEGCRVEAITTTQHAARHEDELQRSIRKTWLDCLQGSAKAYSVTRRGRTIGVITVEPAGSGWKPTVITPRRDEQPHNLPAIARRLAVLHNQPRRRDEQIPPTG